MTDTETQRRALFRAMPGFSDYVACALQDAQYTESDEACMESRDERDTGTIYTLPDATFERMRATYARFLSECAADIETATSDAETGLWLSMERIGSTLWLAQCGSGVTFTDDGNAPCLEHLAQWARAHPLEALYFGDDGEMYLF